MAYMTDEQKYSAVLKELGEVLQSKNTTISCQSWQIDQLKEKLAAAEKERDEAQQEHISADTYIVKAAAQLRRVNVALSKCVNVDDKTIVDAEGLLELKEYIQTALQMIETGGAA